MPARSRTSTPESDPRPRGWRSLVPRLAAIPFLAGLVALPAFLTGRLPGGLAGPAYLVLAAATVLVGWPALPDRHPSVALAALGALGVGLAWAWTGPAIPGDPVVVVDAWRLGLPAEGLPAWWPLGLALPAGLVVLVQAVRGEPSPPVREGERGRLEELPGRSSLFGLTALGLGVAGTLFAGSTFLEKVAVVAPIFEEYAKLGVALLVLTALGLSRGASAYALGLLSGLSFGVLEHHVTYSTEAQAMFVVRVLFHALAAGLSALISVHLQRREALAPGVGWFAIAPAAIVHAANNVAAVAVSIARAMRAIPAWPVSEVLGLVFVTTLVGLALATGLRTDRTLAAIGDLWHRVNGQIDEPQVLPARR
jgi:hypothetical protein